MKGFFAHRTRSIALVVGLLGIPAAKATVLDPPLLRCTEVDVNGDVTLTWVVPPDPTGEFLQYDLYYAPVPGGPFALLTSIPSYALATYTHVGAGANAAPRSYYLTTTSTSAPPNVSVSSDTLSTIYLTVGQSAPLGSAVLDWTLPHAPALPSMAADFGIAMEYPTGTWQSIGSVAYPGHHFEQVISICEDSLTYRISLPDASGCTSQSNFNGDVFQDVTPPTIPIVVNVSVDTATNRTIVTWGPSPEGDTDGYIVVLVTDAGNVILDTLFGRFNTVFEWTFGDPDAFAESFTIAAIDTCWSGIPPSPNTSATHAAHTTVFTSTAYDRCDGTITVDWSPYVGWPVSAYELYVIVDEGTPILLQSLPPGASGYTQAAVAPFHSYCYVVKAIGDTPDHTSLSNKACRYTDYPDVPQWNYLRTATVVANDHIQVIDSVDAGASAGLYQLERSTNGGPWEPVAFAAGGLGSTVVFNDIDVDAHERSYSYRVLVNDSCGRPVLMSNIGATILLLAEPGLDGFNRLRWNGYVQWAGQVAGYTVYRSVDDGPFNVIGTTGPEEWVFADDVQAFSAGRGKFCYRVEAAETGNPSGLDAFTVSNVACAIQEEELWIPNAFIAGGVNSRFQPVLAYADVRVYELTIFNRWGQAIWTTHDPDEGWKGQVDGDFVPQGVYAYYCSIRNGAGKTVERRGSVTFIQGLE